MPIERYCTEKNCLGGDGCTNFWRRPDSQCPFEYVAAPAGSPNAKYNWLGDDPPPARWVAADGTHVYRSFADSCD